MGKSWDGSGIAYDVDMWAECLRVLKPGGHMLAFGGSRTYHRMACAIEDAGFEIRDCLEWVYGSGFPKSLDISKKLDQMAGAEREVIGHSQYEGRRPTAFGGKKNGDNAYGDYNAQPEMLITAPSSPAAKQWSGFGSALKPAHEPICLARKPLDGCTIAENVIKWSCGGLNIDGCRVPAEPELAKNWDRFQSKTMENDRADYGKFGAIDLRDRAPTGRFPANLLLDGSDAVKALFPETKCGGVNGKINKSSGFVDNGSGEHRIRNQYQDPGSASRFFAACPFTEDDIPPLIYMAKASKSERNLGCSSLPLVAAGGYEGRNDGSLGKITYNNNHPTVKPLSLMKILTRLICPPSGLILDPFAGSGTTCMAAKSEGFSYVGIEREPEYVEIAKRRVASIPQPITTYQS